MNATTAAQLANTLAQKRVKEEIVRLNRLRSWFGWLPFTPDYHALIMERITWSKGLEAHSKRLGEGSRPRRKPEKL